MTKPTQKIKKLWEDKTGVSPIIAVILMVAITVVLAATIYVWVSGFGGGGGGGDAMAISQLDGANDGTVTFQVDSASQGLAWDSLNISVGTNWTTSAGDNFTAQYVSAGQELTFNDVTAGETLKIVATEDNSIVVSKTIW